MSAHQTASAPDHEHPVGHIAPFPLLAAVFLTLVVLTVATVAVSEIDLGPFNIAAALLIAVFKGSLVMLFFMHLCWDKPFNAVVFISGLIFLALFIGLSMLDTWQTEPYREDGFTRERIKAVYPAP